MARLLVAEGPWRGLELPLEPGERVLGRGESCAFALPDSALSREHCRFVGDERGWRLEDLGSTNGVAVNGERVTSRVLAAGDVIAAGRSLLRYVDVEDAALLADTSAATAALQIGGDPTAAGASWRAEHYASLLDLGESLARAGGSAEVERVLAAWLLRELPSGGIAIFRRRAGRMIEVAFVPETRAQPSRAKSSIHLPPDVLRAAAEEGRCVFVDSGGNPRLLVPLGAPARVLLAAERLRRAPTTEELRLVGHAVLLAAASLELHARSEALVARVESLGGAPSAESDVPEIVASSKAMRPIADFVDRVALVDSTVLLLGESGTGKELVARAIHAKSARSAGPFVAVNCGALPGTLIESELFGHEKGAFTGASARRAGRFERASSGTLFLDEIGDLPLEAQARLLRVLEDRAVERVGGSEPVPVDVRIIAATNKNLREMTQKGAFREDLYYRLSVLVLELPPLRGRAEDIPVLAKVFLEQCRAKLGRAIDGFSPGALAALAAYRWPGNVRELRNAVERAAILGRGAVIEADELPPEIGAGAQQEPPPATSAASAAHPGAPADAGAAKPVDQVELPLPLAELERLDVLAALRAADGNKSKAARILGVDRATLYARLKEYGVGDAD